MQINYADHVAWDDTKTMFYVTYSVTCRDDNVQLQTYTALCLHLC